MASHATSEVRSDGELRFAGARELVGTGVEHEVGERLAEGGFGVVDHAPRGMVAPRRTHAGLLRSLPWEHDRNAHRLSPPSAVRFRFRPGPVAPGLHNQEHLPTGNRHFALLIGNDDVMPTWPR